MENQCYFVNSRGLLKSCDFHSPNPQSSWCYDKDFLLKMVRGNNMFDGMSIYVCTDMLPFFLVDILHHIRHYFFLVSGDSDATVPHGNIDVYSDPRPLDQGVCVQIANHPKLLKWFAQNLIFTRNNTIENRFHVYDPDVVSKICQLPIGLDYHTISNDPNKFWRDPSEGSLPMFQESILKEIGSTGKRWKDRLSTIYVHFNIGGEGCHRQIALNMIPPELVHQTTDLVPRSQVWKEMVQHVFVMSPYGVGPDCHRTWEALSLGCIPIVQSFGSDEMYRDLPVLVVKEWNEVTAELLQQTLDKFQYASFQYENLSLSYWVRQFTHRYNHSYIQR